MTHKDVVKNSSISGSFRTRILSNPRAFALGYLLALTLAETITVLVDPRAGMILHGMILLAVMLLSALSHHKRELRFLLPLALPPLIRLLSLALPLANFPLIYWYAVIGVPLFIATFLTVRATGLTAEMIGLRLSWRELPIQLLIGLSGALFGFIEYLILRPEPLVSEPSWELVLLTALILLVFTGFQEELELSRHAVICGYGSCGRRVAQALEKQKFTYLVIELDPTVISQLRQQGIPCIYGDASNPEILAHASLDRARILVCTIPDYVAEELTARNAKAINPKLDIVARVHRDSDVELLKNVGVTELVRPFFEGSLEMIRHTLHKFGMSSTEIQYILNNLRESQRERDE